LTASLVLFFFASRGRHTIFSRDWSSDVCSSDLVTPSAPPEAPRSSQQGQLGRAGLRCGGGRRVDPPGRAPVRRADPELVRQLVQIGRAACRGTAYHSVAAVSSIATPGSSGSRHS